MPRPSMSPTSPATVSELSRAAARPSLRNSAPSGTPSRASSPARRPAPSPARKASAAPSRPCDPVPRRLPAVLRPAATPRGSMWRPPGDRGPADSSPRRPAARGPREPATAPMHRRGGTPGRWRPRSAPAPVSGRPRSRPRRARRARRRPRPAPAGRRYLEGGQTWYPCTWLPPSQGARWIVTASAACSRTTDW